MVGEVWTCTNSENGTSNFLSICGLFEFSDVCVEVHAQYCHVLSKTLRSIFNGVATYLVKKDKPKLIDLVQCRSFHCGQSGCRCLSRGNTQVECLISVGIWLHQSEVDTGQHTVYCQPTEACNKVRVPELLQFRSTSNETFRVLEHLLVCCCSTKACPIHKNFELH